MKCNICQREINSSYRMCPYCGTDMFAGRVVRNAADNLQTNGNNNEIFNQKMNHATVLSNNPSSAENKTVPSASVFSVFPGQNTEEKKENKAQTPGKKEQGNNMQANLQFILFGVMLTMQLLTLFALILILFYLF